MKLPIRGFLKTIRTTQNWYSVLFFSFLIRQRCVAKFRNGNRFVIDRDQRPNYSFIRDMMYDNLRMRGPKVRILVDREFGQILDLGGYKFVISSQFSFDSLYLVFFRQLFPEEDLSGSEVIDIGGYTGDTAIYFASKGARVHAYEPVPEAFAMMQRNIALNRLESMVLAYNCAVTEDMSSAMSVDTDTYEGSTTLSDLPSSLANGTKIQVETVTLKDAYARCGQRSRKVLKLNCEGCEFSVISAANGTLLKNFDEVICFYHSFLTGIPKEQLIEVLQQNGFDVGCNDSRSLIVARRPKNSAD